MKKNRMKSSEGKASLALGKSASVSKSTVPWGPLSPRAQLLEVVLAKGFEGAIQMLEADREVLCGPNRRWQEDRQAYRYGFDEGRLVLGGRTVKLRKRRVRSTDGRELELPTWRQLAEEDPLQARVLRQILGGVTTREYATTLDDMPEGLAFGLTSSSSVSRRFVAITKRRVQEFLSRTHSEACSPA